MEKKEIVVKDFNLINARYKLTVTQSKIILKIISMINNKFDTELFENHQIPFSHFDFLTDNKNYSILKKECDNLLTKLLKIKRENGDDLTSHWFSSIEYKYKLGVIELSIDPKLKPYLIQLKKSFKYYNLYNIMQMKSEYSIRIYELCKQAEFMKKRKFELSELHDILQVPKSLINSFKDFRIRALEKAKNEINRNSDIFINFEAIRRGRTIYWIEFTIEKNEKNILEHKMEENELKNEVIKDFEKFKEMFVMYKFDLDDFETEFESFKIFNDNKIDKVTLINFDKWCMQKRRKLVEKEQKNKGREEQKAYRWDFRKAKNISDNIKKYLKFDLGIDYLDYYWKDELPFTIENKTYDIKQVMHPDFNKNEYLIFVVDEKDENSKYLLNYEEDIIDV